MGGTIVVVELCDCVSCADGGMADREGVAVGKLLVIGVGVGCCKRVECWFWLILK